MNRAEALHLLGLDEEATSADIKTAYKEMAQILHPDRFESNKKLQDRATEQFKKLQQAYDLLGGANQPGEAGRAREEQDAQRGLRARLAGIQAARVQLLAQRDAVSDDRRNGLIIGALGLAVGVLIRNSPIAVALGGVALVWGVVKAITCHATIGTLDEHIAKLRAEQQKLEEELE